MKRLSGFLAFAVFMLTASCARGEFHHFLHDSEVDHQHAGEHHEDHQGLPCKTCSTCSISSHFAFKQTSAMDFDLAEVLVYGRHFPQQIKFTPHFQHFPHGDRAPPSFF